MKKAIKIGTILKGVEVDGRIKLKVGKRVKIRETYEIIITEVKPLYIKAKCV